MAIPPDPMELSRPPPEIRLPPNVSFANDSSSAPFDWLLDCFVKLAPCPTRSFLSKMYSKCSPCEQFHSEQIQATFRSGYYTLQNDQRG